MLFREKQLVKAFDEERNMKDIAHTTQMRRATISTGRPLSSICGYDTVVVREAIKVVGQSDTSK